MGCNRKKRGVEGMEGKSKGSYLRLIPGLCPEDGMTYSSHSFTQCARMCAHALVHVHKDREIK